MGFIFLRIPLGKNGGYSKIRGIRFHNYYKIKTKVLYNKGKGKFPF